MYERISHIPFQNRLHVAELNFGDYESYPAKLKCPVKLLSDGMRYFPGTIQLVTFRIRDADVKVETGDEEADAEYMTKFKFWKEEFEYHTRSEDVTVTFSLKLLKQFLSAWDKKNHDIECYFKEGNGIVFTTTISGVKTRLMLASVIKDHAPNSPVPTGDETINSTNVTYLLVSSPITLFKTLLSAARKTCHTLTCRSAI